MTYEIVNLSFFLAFLLLAGCTKAKLPSGKHEANESTSESLVEKIDESEQIGAYVRRIFQDREGNLWFSTDKGVCRFDGTTLDYPLAELKGAPEQILQDSKWCNLVRYGRGCKSS